MSKTLKFSMNIALFSILLATTAVAQYGDTGQYTILQARYGTERNNVDVTRRLQELARSDRSCRMGNSTFGVDPDPGRVKTLRIYARDRNGRNRMFEYREGSTVDGSLFSGWSGGDWGGGWDGGWGGPGNGDSGQYTILQARYGTERNNVDVTRRLQELARADQRFRMGNSTFGVDPDPGRVKTLRIYTRDRSGRTRTFEYREGSTVDGSQFSGWRSGNWGGGGWNGGWNPGNGGGHGNRPPGYGQLSIVSAQYGAGGRGRNVASILQSQIRNGRLSISVNNDSMGGDPAPGQSKRLAVSYSVNGQRRSANVSEGQQLNIP